MGIRNRGIWLLPVIVLAIPIIQRSYNLIRLLRLRNENPTNPILRFFFEMNFYYQWGNILTVIFLVEICIYYLIRRRRLRVMWVFIHTVLSAIAFIVLPLLHGTGILIREGIEVPYWEGIVLFLIPAIVGHVFFILTIVKSFQKKQPELAHESTGLLDEFVN